MNLSRLLSFASLAFGVLFYVLCVSGLLFDEPTPPTDVGAVSTSVVFVLFGLLGLALKPVPAKA